MCALIDYYTMSILCSQLTILTIAHGGETKNRARPSIACCWMPAMRAHHCKSRANPARDAFSPPPTGPWADSSKPMCVCREREPRSLVIEGILVTRGSNARELWHRARPWHAAGRQPCVRTAVSRMAHASTCGRLPPQRRPLIPCRLLLPASRWLSI